MIKFIDYVFLNKASYFQDNASQILNNHPVQLLVMEMVRVKDFVKVECYINYYDANNEILLCY